MIDQQIAIPTTDGQTAHFLSHPERGGAVAVIMFFMGAPAFRERLRDRASRPPTPAYYVVPPNPY